MGIQAIPPSSGDLFRSKDVRSFESIARARSERAVNQLLSGVGYSSKIEAALSAASDGSKVIETLERAIDAQEEALKKESPFDKNRLITEPIKEKLNPLEEKGIHPPDEYEELIKKFDEINEQGKILALASKAASSDGQDLIAVKNELRRLKARVLEFSAEVDLTSLPRVARVQDTLNKLHFAERIVKLKEQDEDAGLLSGLVSFLEVQDEALAPLSAGLSVQV